MESPRTFKWFGVTFWVLGNLSVLTNQDFFTNDFRASILAQHLKGSLNFDMLKDQMLKADDSMNSVLQDNKKLVGDNKNLEDRVLALTIEAKGLETHAVNVEALVRS